jgi:ABC-type sugar transport system permease subunit/ABC-type glycerol-3-phosphate transport system substrate-binding protein
VCLALLFWALCALIPAHAADRPVTIEVPVFEGGAGLSFYFHAARAFEEARPDVSVDIYGDPRIVDKIRVRILEGTYPEVTNAGLNYWILIRSGDVLPLDEYLDGPSWTGETTWRESFLPGSLDSYTQDGKTYGIPLQYAVHAVWYNRNMFEAHGWQKPTTWAEFQALCEQIKGEGIAPLAFQGRYPNYSQGLTDNAYYHLAGRQRFYEQKALDPGSFDNPEFVRALQLVQHTGANYFQSGSEGMSHTEAQMEFFLGHTAMILCGSWLKSEMQGKIPDGFRLGTFSLPITRAGKADPKALYTTAGYFFVLKGSRHPEVGVDFLRFMTSEQMAGDFARMRDIVVAVRGAMAGNLTEDMHELMRIVQNATTTFGQAPGEGYPEFDQFLEDARFQLLSGTSTPQETATFLEGAARAVRSRSENPDAVTVRHVWKPAFLLLLLGAAIAYWVWSTLRRRAEKRRQTTAAATSTGRVRLSWVGVVFFLGPATVLYTLIVIIPALKSFSWALHRWDGLTGMTWVGLLHFQRLLLESDGFWTALGNNLFIMFVIPCFVLPLALFLAVCISRELWGSRVFRIVFFFPNILGQVAASLLWMHLYNPQGGPVNAILTSLGLDGFEGFAWLAQDNLYWALVPMSIWAAAGFNMILFLAAMESIPSTVYEAAEIDGASPWRQFWMITLPLIWEVLSISIVFMIIGGMKAFEVIWLLTNQSPTSDNHVIGTRMVQAMFEEFHVGEATAIAVILFLIVFFGTTVTLRLMRRETVEF